MRRILDGLNYGVSDFLAPRDCAVCERSIGPRYLVCRDCQEILEESRALPDRVLPNTGLPPFCLQDRKYFYDRRFCLYESTPAWQALLHAWKFGNQRSLYKIFLNALEKMIPLLIECQIERIGIIASPLGRSSSRNYRPCWDLARWLAWRMGIPVGMDIHKSSSALQSQRGYEDRFWQMHGSLHSSLSEGVGSYLLLEDIYTTGASANEAARLLKEQGVGQVNVLCMLLRKEIQVV